LPDLEETLREIEAYLRQEQIAVFYGDELEEPKYVAEIVWADDKPDWKEFVRAAKEAGTKVIIIQRDRLNEETFESGEEDSSGPSADFRNHIGKVGQLILFWIRDGVKYTFPITTTWWDERASTEELYEQEIPSEIKKKSPEELSREFADYMEQEHPELVGENYLPESITSVFWKNKGLEIHHLDEDDMMGEEISEKVETAQRLGIELWEQRMKEKESKIVPHLIEECDEWARENGLRGISRSNLNAFLGEKEVSLSSEARERIYSRVSVLLRKMSGKEKEILPRLVKECCEWAKEAGLRKVTRAHISEFLDEKGQSLSFPARDSLYTKVVISLKRQ